MGVFHIQAQLPGGRTKLVNNLGEDEVRRAVEEFNRDGTFFACRSDRLEFGITTKARVDGRLRFSTSLALVSKTRIS